MVGHVTTSAAARLDPLPGWVMLVRAPNPGPMTLEGTNSWLLTAPGGATVLVDPGPADEAHLASLAAYRPSLILVTHGHPDHVEGLPRLLDLLGPVEVWYGTGGGRDLDGLSIEPLATPGHTGDSVCYAVEVAGETDCTQAVLTGDTVLGRGTTVVAYPDGDLRDYLGSLERLVEVGPVPVLPGHGPALADCAAAARRYLAHRRARLDQVRQALAVGARTTAEVVELVYADVDRALWPAAALSVRAQLAYLESSPPDVRWDTP
jgi:glyoxylase-like metal-dependent hydrolase (beta-lactamase superfamily II)